MKYVRRVIPAQENGQKVNVLMAGLNQIIRVYLRKEIYGKD